MKRAWIPISIFAIIGGYFIYSKAAQIPRTLPVINKDLLRSEIIRSITIPFNKADTMVLDTAWLFCGNTDKSERPVIFSTQLGEETQKHALEKQVKKHVLSSEEFNKEMDSVLLIRFKGEYPESLWDVCRVGKVAAEIKAEQLSPRKVRLYESYLYADSVKSTNKDFVFDGEKWSYEIIDTKTEILKK